MARFKMIFALLISILFFQKCVVICQPTYSTVEEPNEFPYEAQLPNNCAGTVYNKDWILTSASCVIKNEKLVKKLKVSLSHVDPNVKSFGVSEIVIRDDYLEVEKFIKGTYSDPKYYNDIALVKLDRSIDFRQSNIFALEIAPANFRSQSELTVLKWDDKETLLAIDGLFHNDTACTDGRLGEYSYKENEKRLLCLAENVINSSGGAAIGYDQDGFPLLCGLRSFGGPEEENSECLNRQNGRDCPPSVYSDIGYFHSWIVDNAGEQDPVSLFKPKVSPTQAALEERTVHQVHLVTDDGRQCGGTLVSKDTVVTAAHCAFLDDKRPRPGVKIDAFLQNVQQQSVPQNRYYGSGQIVHGLGFTKYASFDTSNGRATLYEDDIAVIKLNRSVDIAPERLPRLPTIRNFNPGAGSEVAYPSDSREAGDIIHTELTILTKEECQEKLQSKRELASKHKLDTNIVMCAVQTTPTTCNREVGGGIFCLDKKGQEYFCGVQIFRSCEASFPHLFVNVGEFKPMIKILTDI